MAKTLAYGYSSERVLSESFPMNTNMTGYGFHMGFTNIFRRCALEEVASALEGLRYRGGWNRPPPPPPYKSKC